MQLKLRAIWQLRPRFLTLIVFVVALALIVVANLSAELHDAHQADDEDLRNGGLRTLAFGWPLTWHRFILLSTPALGGALAWQWNAVRFTGDAIVWLAILSAPVAACEWQLRRHRPRLRWSLRSMLAAVALLAAFTAWIAMARNRARLQDPLITEIEANDGQVWVHRSGPKWFDVVGADRFRRQITAVDVEEFDEGGDGGTLLQRLAQLETLRSVFISSDHVTSAMAEALGDMPQLQVLSVEQGRIGENELHVSQKLFAAIGRMNNLQHLDVCGLNVDSECLARLAPLTNLKSLGLTCISLENPSKRDEPLLARLPVLSQLEAVYLDFSDIGDRDIDYLAVLPRLKSLSLDVTSTTDKGLEKLACLEALEELSIDGDMETPQGLTLIANVMGLKKLHLNRLVERGRNSIGGEQHKLRENADKYGKTTLAVERDDKLRVVEAEADAFRHALDSLRRSHPGVVVDSIHASLGWWTAHQPRWEYDTFANHTAQMPWQLPWLTLKANKANSLSGEIDNLKW
jgi:hypothetical protein